MTSREQTGLLPLAAAAPERPLNEKLLTVAWALIQWPWLLRSLRGGPRAVKRRLLERLDLPEDALPNLGSWKADTALLEEIVGTIERTRPEVVVELGCGASSLVIARALERNGGGRLISYDQHEEFVAATLRWLRQFGLDADLRHAPLVRDPAAEAAGWASTWYRLDGKPGEIDMIVIDGPPWTLNPFIRGRAEVLFDQLRAGGTILLDDAARPGERVIARRWRKAWPGIRFRLDKRGTKGTLIGTKRDSA